MTSVTEVENAPGDLEGLQETLEVTTRSTEPERAELGADKQQNANESGTTDSVEKPDFIPDKFWTGNVEESVAKMGEGYKNLESAYGRQSNDLGVQRQITDRLLSQGPAPATDTRTSGTSQPPKERKKVKIDPGQLVDNPTEALDAYFEVREAELREEFDQRLRSQETREEELAFVQKHPDYAQIAADEQFAGWVNSSPLRSRAAELASGGDFTVADELLTEYKALNGKGPAPVTRDADGNNVTSSDESALLAAAKQASTESAAQANHSSGKPTYRRADLIALKVEKPDVYSDPKFQDEILRAYAEGRVR